MEVRQVLQEMDKHATEFDFPVLDNAYVEFAAARLTAFIGSRDWLIVFEVLGFSTREIQFVVDVYGFGSCVERQGFIGQQIPITSIPSRPLFDPDTNEFIANPDSWSIQHDDKILSFSPTADEYQRAGIAIERNGDRYTFREIQLLRFLVGSLGADRFMLNDQTILHIFPRCSNMNKFIQTTEWQHPDIADGEKPSATTSMTSLLQAMAERDPSRFERGVPNTTWESWAS